MSIFESTTCPHCGQPAGLDPSTGQVYCGNCGVLQPPKFERQRKPFMTCQVLAPIPTFMCSGKRPWHAQYLEMHLMGVHRMMFYHDLFSDRFNQAVIIERIYKDMGLITYFSMN